MIVFLLAGIMAAMLIFRLIYQRVWDKSLSVDFSINQPYAYAGDSIQLYEKIENRKRMPVSPVEVRFRTQRGMALSDTNNTAVSDYVYKRDIYSILGNQRITRSLKMDCRKRGIYSIEDVSVVTYSLLHDKLYQKKFETDVQIYVYPRRTNVSQILSKCENLLGDKESNRKYLEDPFAFSSIREYTLQDPMKNINWKASAKTGGLMVNTFSSMHNERMMIYLDVEDSRIIKKENLIEESISIAATLFQKLQNKGTEVGICVNFYDDNRTVLYMPPSRKKGNRTRLEQALCADLSNREIISFEKMFSTIYEEKSENENVIPLVISKNVSEDKVKAVEKYVKNMEKGLWIIPCDKDDNQTISTDRFSFIKREVRP